MILMFTALSLYGEELKCMIDIINRYKSDNQQSPDKWVVGIPQMGRIIALYTYAKYIGKSVYEKRADKLLEQLLENEINIIPSLGHERSLCCLGCGLIYILRNGLAEGEEDEVLAELDRRLITLSINWNQDEDSLCGWIHYLTLRVHISNDTQIFLYNKQNLIQLLDCLENHQITDKYLFDDIQKIDALGIFPERTKRLLGKGENLSLINNEIEKLTDDHVTFVIPVRIDSLERQKNLDVVLDLLSKRNHTKIIVLEADCSPIYKVKDNYPNVSYRFVKDENPVFYRTKYLNELLKYADTSIVGVWDTDVIVPNEQIDQSIFDIYEGKAAMSFPYGGCFNFCSKEDSIVFRNERSMEYLQGKEYYDHVLHSVGGAFLVNKDVYIKAGGENEHFYGWGMEDLERVKRMEILKLPVTHVKGMLFHLFHYRNENSRFYSQALEVSSREEYLKICSMSKEQLKQYIKTWKNISAQLEVSIRNE